MSPEPGVIPSSNNGRRVLLIGWDAADARLVNELRATDAMPAVAALVEHGACGELRPVGPPVESMAWTTIATGMRPDRHGVLDDVEFDHGTGIWTAVSAHARQVHAIWNLTTLAGLRAVVVGWAAGHPAEPILGTCVDERFVTITGPADQAWPVADASVHPPSSAARLEDLRLHPSDIHGEELAAFMPSLAEIDLQRDPRPVGLADALARTVSLHGVATDLLEREDWRFAAIRYPLLGRLAGTFLRCRQPRGDGVPEEDVRHYGGVIDAAHHLLDAMLARLRALAGPDTTVILTSQCGMHPERRRRPAGLVAIAGPDTRRNGLVHGASQLDIVPTILAELGLPAGCDMPGRVLDEAFAPRPAPPRIPTWHMLPGDAGLLPQADPVTSWESHEAIRQLVALGYATSDPQADARHAAIAAQADFNRGLVHLDAGEWTAAADAFRKVVTARTSDMQARLRLAFALSHLGAIAECRALIDGIPDDSPFAPHAEGIRGLIATAEGRHEDAVAHLLACEAGLPPMGFLLDRLGWAYIRLGRFDEAERVLRRSRTLAPEGSFAPFTLAGIHLHHDRPREAVDEALEAIARRYRWPEAHVRLGIALARLGRVPEAMRAFEISIAQAPSAAAHEALAALFEQSGGEPTWIEHHRARADALREGSSRT